MSRSSNAGYLSVLAGVAMAALLLLCPTTGARAQQRESPVTIAYNLPRDHATGTFFEVLAREIAERTARTSLKLIPRTFPDGQLYNDSQLPEAIGSGAVDIGQVNLGFVSGPDARVLRIWALPFLYTSWEAEWASEDSPEFREIFTRQLGKYGQKMLGWVQYGVVEIYANKSIQKPADVKGLRLRGFGVDSVTLLRDLGASPVTMSSQEIYQGVMRGIIDGFSTGPSSVIDRKLYEVTKFGTDVGLSFIPFIASANQKWWESLPKDTQEAVEQAALAAQKAARSQAKADNEKLREKLVGHGVKIHTPTPAERQLWLDAAKSRQSDYLKTAGEDGKRMLDVVARENAKWAPR